MSRILILGNSSTGLYDFRNGLLLRLLRQGHEVTVSLPDETRRPELEREGCRFVLTPIDRRGMNPLRDGRLLLEYLRLLRESRPDLVLTYTIKPNIYGGLLCRLLRLPRIATITGLGSTFERGGLVKRLVTLLYRLGLKGAACVFFQNAENRALFADGILGRGARTRLVSGSGVDLDRHRPEPYPGHGDGVVRFLYVGRLMREKGTREYLAAAEKLHAHLGDRVSVAAIGYCDEDLQATIDRAVEKGFFKFLPYDPEIHRYLREADAVVMPSYHEGMSNVVMEAAATARAALASDISGCRELIGDGETGYLFPPRNAEKLYQAMLRFARLSEEERRRMGERGRRRMERQFDRERVLDAYMEEIGNIIK